MQRFLVTGGAGFVGSHVVLALLDRGHEVVVFDNLAQGHRAAVPSGVRFIKGDLGDAPCVDAVIADGPWDGVLHFAALSLVGESMQQPFRYLLDNAVNGIRLIEACARHGVGRFVLSSTANLFGNAGGEPIQETAPIDPGSPYGESKLMIERTLKWADACCGLRSACLRYFNAAGADAKGRAGEDHAPETHLIPLVIDAALCRRPEIGVFGTDYPTLDGTLHPGLYPRRGPCRRAYPSIGSAERPKCDLQSRHWTGQLGAGGDPGGGTDWRSQSSGPAERTSGWRPRGTRCVFRFYPKGNRLVSPLHCARWHCGDSLGLAGGASERLRSAEVASSCLNADSRLVA